MLSCFVSAHDTSATLEAGQQVIEHEDQGSVRATIEKENKGWIFPLIYYKSREGKDGQFNLLWRFYDSVTKVKKDAPDFKRQRVLWRLMVRETEGERVSTDLFPFIAYDRGEDLVKWSFMGGLLGHERQGDAKTTRILYIPLRSRKSAE